VTSEKKSEKFSVPPPLEKCSSCAGEGDKK